MKTVSERLKQRRVKGRAMETIGIRMPKDVIDDLKEIAPTLGFSGYQPLIRAYIGQGLRRDQFELEDSQMQRMTKSLRSQGVADEVIAEATHLAKSKTLSKAS
jgi:hypothetical protein